MKTLITLLDQLENEQIEREEGLTEFIRDIRDSPIIRKIIICLLNNSSAKFIVLTRMTLWLMGDGEEDGEEDGVYDNQIAALLLAFIDTDFDEVDALSNSLADSMTLPSTALIANSYLLHKELTDNDKLRFFA